jgi:hypothetical protein
MKTILIILAAQAALLVAVFFAPQAVRLWLAKQLRRYANRVSPDNF